MTRILAQWQRHRRGMLTVAGVVLAGGTVGLAVGGLRVLSEPTAAAASPGPSASSAPSTTAAPTVSPLATLSATPVPTVEPTPTPSATPAPATPGPTPTPRPTGAAALSWTAAAVEGNALSIEWLGDRWLAVGQDGLRAATWTSQDGSSWVPGSPVDPPGSEDPDNLSGYWMTDVIEHEGLLIAVGWNSIGGGDGGRAVLWTSEDGVNWAFHDPAGTPYGEVYHFPHELGHLASGDLILMSDIDLGNGSILWTSTDGQAWTEIPTDWEQDPVRDLAVGPHMLMAVGYSVFEDNLDEAARVYLSSDGHSWNQLAAPPGALAVSQVAYDSASGRFVVGGSDREERPTVWTTADGRAWATTTLDDRSGAVGAVEAADGLIVMTGGTWVGEYEDPAGMAWASHDAITWSIYQLGESGGETGVSPGGAVVWQSVFENETYVTTQRVWTGILR